MSPVAVANLFSAAMNLRVAVPMEDEEDAEDEEDEG